MPRKSKFINPKTGKVSHWSAFEKKKKKKKKKEHYSMSVIKKARSKA